MFRLEAACEIMRSGKPVIASVDSVGASGGYYIAAACDEIVANPGSITGSIGVILDWMNVEDCVAYQVSTCASHDMNGVDVV